MRPSLRAHPAVSGAVIVFCLAALFWWFWPIRPVLGQICALAAIALGFRYAPPVTGWLARLPVPHRVVFALLIAGVIAGHFTFDGRKYFPFVSWEIFSIMREEDPVTCREFAAVTASGKNVRLLVEQLFPSIVQFNPPADNESAAMTRLVDALRKAYDGRHPGDPVRRVDLVRISVRLQPGGNPPSCELLKRYDFSPAPSN